MAKKMDAQEFKEAVKALNAVLKKAGEPTIKMVGAKKDDIVRDFTNKVLDYIENDNVENLPDSAINVYNKYIVDTNEDEDETEVQGKVKAESKATPKKKAKADTKAKAAPKTSTKEKDEFGFIVGSNNSKLAELLSTKAMKMGEIKKEMGNTYYELFKRKTDVFAKTDDGVFYVIGSDAKPSTTSAKAKAAPKTSAAKTSAKKSK